jgi:hypothetical protein
MRKHPIGAAWVIGLYIIVMLSAAGQAPAATAHNGQIWQGSQACLTCHDSEALEMHGSSHYQWQGQALYTVNGPDVQGKLNTALNSYCISILGNWNACGSCHVGLGAKPEATATPSQLQNIDCLICHQKDYKRKKVSGVFVPDTVNMIVTMDQAVQTVHKPVRSNCVQCHAKGGGGDNNKRGDMTLAHAATTDRNFDVHMSSTGANLTCQQCHTTQNHRIAGRGSDLRQTDLDVQVNCSTATCHTNKKTATGHATTDVNKHVNRVACQTCHIKTYARNAADTVATETTEVYRNWTTPEWSTALSRWEPLITRGGDLKPVYTFWNGTSWNYSLNETVRFEAATGAYPTSRPEGGINNTGSMLYPFKYKKALQPLADSLSVLVALDTSVYFSTGDYDSAVKAGLTNMGHPGNTLYRNVDTDTYQLITHEVMPKGNALTCTECHTSTATQMDLKGMGYAMKGSQSTTCTQCHGQKSIPSYTSLHNKHVTDKKYDCSWCHGFSRPERGLKMPSGQPGADTTAPSVTVFAIPSTADSLTVAITAFSASDNIGVTGYLLTETATKPFTTTAGWTSARPTSYTFASAGAKTLYAWARDAAGNISTSLMGSVTITLPVPPDTTSPVVTAFSIPSSSGSLTVAISTFTANDNVEVTGYLLTETATKPSATAAGWTSTRPASYTFASAGVKTLYAWAKDAGGNVSNSSMGLVTITLSAPSSPKSDFNGDGKLDILWRNATTGENRVWFMDGTTLTGTASLPTTSVLAWTIGGVGDFNNDGKPDILWRRPDTGKNAVWFMDGTTCTGTASLPVESDTNWMIAGTGDFNGDGKPDILWRNVSTGENRVWFMDGIARAGTAALPTTSILAWTIGGVGDFNNDGKPDILWRRFDTGQNAVWLMDGVTYTGTASLPKETDTNLKIVGTGDLNADGKTDILWRNASTGANSVWYMNGTAYSGGAPIPVLADTNWTIANH